VPAVFRRSLADGTAASVAIGVADGITDVVTRLVGTGVDVGVDVNVEIGVDVGMAVSTATFGNNGESGKKSATSGIQFGGRSILKDDRVGFV
jgi:hypothetical protein